MLMNSKEDGHRPDYINGSAESLAIAKVSDLHSATVAVKNVFYLHVSISAYFYAILYTTLLKPVTNYTLALPSCTIESIRLMINSLIQESRHYFSV